MITTYFLATVGISVLSYAVLNYEELKKIFDAKVPLQTLITDKDKLFTQNELSNFKETKLYLSILGQVFDVTKGKKHYGPGNGYHGFVGRDGSKAFVTGDFTENGFTDDISTLSPTDLLGLKDWVKLYEKDYVYKGKLIGRFYDENGNATPFLNQIRQKIETAELNKKTSNDLELKYPPCNVEWDQKKGTRIWCSTQSGGIKRDWIGYPRKFFQPGKNYRCACVKNIDGSKLSQNRHGSFEIYKGCKIDSTSCNVEINTR